MGEGGNYILVTGGAGYIGSVLIPMLLQAGKRVVVLDTREPIDGAGEVLRHSNLRIICGSVQDPAVVEAGLLGVDRIIYLAGVSDGRAGKADPELTRSVNIDAFRSFVEHARRAGCRQLVFASTFGVYGYSYREPLTEELLPDPQEPYSESKLAAEQMLQQANEAGFVTTSLRFAMVYGLAPRMRWDFLVNRLLADAFQKKHIRITGGSQVRPQIHIEDACLYLAGMLDLPADKIAGKVFNACGFNKSVEQIAHEIKSYMGPELQITFLPYREGEHSFTLDPSRLKNATGLFPTKTLLDTIGEFEVFFRSTANQKQANQTLAVQ